MVARTAIVVVLAATLPTACRSDGTDPGRSPTSADALASTAVHDAVRTTRRSPVALPVGSTAGSSARPTDETIPAGAAPGHASERAVANPARDVTRVVVKSDGRRPSAAAEPTQRRPSIASLARPGPHFVRRAPSALSTVTPGHAQTDAGASVLQTRLEVRHGDGRLEAIWSLPDGASVRRVSDAVSPDGRRLAFFTGGIPDWHLSMPVTNPVTLHVWDLSVGAEILAAPILDPGFRDDLRRQVASIGEAWDASPYTASGAWNVRDTALGMAAEDVVLAVWQGIGDVAWSPDGARLAFVGALDGPSTDVYVLTVDTGRILRVSDEATHVIHLAWSPDGTWILHEGAPMARRGGGSAVGETTVVSASDGSSRTRVWHGSGFDPRPGQAWPDAWSGSATAVLHARGNGCGVCEIAIVDASAGVSRTLLQPSVGSGFAVGPAGKWGALAARVLPRGIASGSRETAEGVHLLALDGSGTSVVHDRMCDVARWDADDLPFVWLPTYRVGGCSATAFGLGGRRQPIDVQGDLTMASVSPARRWRVLYGGSGWQVFDRANRHVASYPSSASGATGLEETPTVEAVAWHPDDAALYWLQDDQLWISELPDGRPRRVAAWPRTSYMPPDIDVAWLRR